MGEIRVFDLEGVERDFEYARDKYGVAFRRANAEMGYKVYRLVELREKTGSSALVTKVLDEAGRPMHLIDVALWWQDAPYPPEPMTNVTEHDWEDNFVHGLTNKNGDVGPGMGTGAYHGEGEGGPHAVWVRSANNASDICEKLGMLAGTNHTHLDQVFQLQVEGGEGMPEKGQFVEIGRRFDGTEGENRIVIEAIGERNFYETRAHMVVGDDPDDPDYEFSEPFHPVEIALYRLGANYEPMPDEEQRTFWITIQTPQGVSLSEPLGFTYETNSHGLYVAQVEWVEGEEPLPPEPPEPEPPDDVESLAALFRAMAVAHDGMAEMCRRIAEVLGGIAAE
jgi:hypothetical protein